MLYASPNRIKTSIDDDTYAPNMIKHRLSRDEPKIDTKAARKNHTIKRPDDDNSMMSDGMKNQTPGSLSSGRGNKLQQVKQDSIHEMNIKSRLDHTGYTATNLHVDNQKGSPPLSHAQTS